MPQQIRTPESLSPPYSDKTLFHSRIYDFDTCTYCATFDQGVIFNCIGNYFV